jgi:PAS domain S-box-containing protein
MHYWDNLTNQRSGYHYRRRLAGAGGCCGGHGRAELPGFRVPADMGGVAVGRPSPGDIGAGSGTARPELLAAILDSCDDAIVGETLGGVITSWNPAAARMYGYQAAEAIGQPVTVLCPAGRVTESKEILGRIGRGERVVHHQSTRRRKDGTVFPVSVTVSPVHDEHGRITGAVSVARDLTGQQRTAAELRRLADDVTRANRNLANFTITVSHDLAAPLRAMSGFSTALLEECPDALGEDGRGYAERIRAASDRMAGLLNDLLRLSLLSRTALRPERADLGAEASRIAAELQRDSPDRGAHFVIQRPVWVRADPRLMRTVLRSLLDNAWKFTSRRDDALIEFGTAPAPAPDAGVCCYVRDNGVGFDPAYADKLFTPFWRLPTARDFPGTGTGLAGVRQIVERHGGHAWAESAVGEGATFFFTVNGRETA